MAQTEWQEQIRVEGAHLLDEIKQLVHEGNVRHIVVRHDDHIILEIPVTGGVAIALLAPTFAAVGAVGAMIAHCTLEVVRVGEDV